MISDKASVCPKCGEPNTPHQNTKEVNDRSTEGLRFSAILAIVMMIGSFILFPIYRTINTGDLLNRVGKQFDNTKGNESVEEKRLQNDDANSQKKINTNWEYYKETQMYHANINSTDGNLMFSLAMQDDNWKLTVFSIIWLDDNLPERYGKTIIGVKFPGDEHWQKIGIKCKKRYGGLELLTYSDFLRRLKGATSFTILYSEIEYEFAPQKPLEWLE